jgi:hypothetical protein
MISKPLKNLSGVFLALLPILVPLLAVLIVSNFNLPTETQFDFVIYLIVVVITIGFIVKLLLSYRWFRKIMTYHDPNKEYQYIIRDLIEYTSAEIATSKKFQMLLKGDSSEQNERSLFINRDFTEVYNCATSFYIVWRIAQYAQNLPGLPKWTDFKTGLLTELYKSELIPKDNNIIKAIYNRKSSLMYFEGCFSFSFSKG